MGQWCKDLALCPQVENLKEKLISQAQEVSRLRSELVRPGTFLRGGVGVSSHGHSSTSGCGMRLSLSIHALFHSCCLVSDVSLHTTEQGAGSHLLTSKRSVNSVHIFDFV